MNWQWRRVLALACLHMATCFCVKAEIEEQQEGNMEHSYDFLHVEDETFAKKETHEEFIENWVLIVLFIVIIGLSIIFETLVGLLEKYLRHRHLYKLQEMLNCAFKELTILGFISLFLYTTIRLGAVRKVNDKYLGISKTEEAAIAEAEAKGEEPYPPTHLTETFETIHVLIFMIMLIFIMEVAAFTGVGYHMMRHLAYLDTKTEEDLKNDISISHTLQQKKAIQTYLQHWGLRYRFMFSSNPLISKPRKSEPGRPQFSFSVYLIDCFGDDLSIMIDLPPSILILTLIIVILLRPALSLSGREIIIFMILAAFGLLISTYFSLSFLIYTERKILPDINSLFSLFQHPQNISSEEIMKALHSPIDDRPLATTKRWPRKHVVNRTAALFPFGNPLYYKRLLQLLLFFHAAYTAVLLMCFFAEESASRYIWWESGAFSYPLTLIPLASSFYLWTRILKKFTTVFHLDFLASANKIREVEAEQDKAVLQRDVQFLEYLMHQGGKIEYSAAVQLQSLLATYNRLSPQAQNFIKMLFSCLAEHPERFPHPEAPGVVSRQAIEDVIRCIRPETTSKEDARTFAEDWFRLVDARRSGYLQFDDFKAFVVLLGSLGVDPKEYTQHQKSTLGRLFSWLDTDGDREISLAELEGALSGMHPPISKSETLSLLDRLSLDRQHITEESIFAWAVRTRMRSRVIPVHI